MRKAGLLVWKAHDQVSKIIRPGITTREIDAVIDAVFRAQNARPLFKGVAGTVPFPAATCTSVNDEVVHGIPSDRELKEGDIVSVDTGCQIDGWCGDAAHTHAVGQVSETAQDLLDVAKGALDLAIQLLHTRSMWSQIAYEMAAFVQDSGFSVVEDLVGHGIGRQMHEEPSVPNYWAPELTPEADFRIEPGLVLAIEPMVNSGGKKVKCLDDHWTQVTEDGSLSAHFEHTVAILDSGPIRLTAEPGSEADQVLQS
jgi:methionyl aminopeptidase